MNPDLKGMRVLVTRPEGRAQALVDAIAAAGGAAVVLPLLQIVPLDETEDADTCRRTRSQVLELDRYRRLIFISVNAVVHGCEWIHQYWPQLPLGQRYYAIGEATAKALQAEGLPVVANATNSAWDSESLLSQADFAAPDGEHILIFRGVGGREYLAEQLRARGAIVDYAECYRRRAPQLTAAQLATTLKQEGIDCAAVNSGETLQHLAQLLTSEQRAALPVVVPSARVVAAAAELGFARVQCAANAGTEATLQALQAVAAERAR